MTDFLIVGGGTAGCVLANRLSALGAEVRLLEAGRDTPPNAIPADIADLYPRSYYNVPVTMLAEHVAERIANRNRLQASEPRAASRR